MLEDVLARVEWRKSSFSGSGGKEGGECVEVASLKDGRVGIRDSKCPEGDVILLSRSAMTAWVSGLKAELRG